MSDFPAPRARLRGLVKRFGALRAVDGADLALYPGEIHGLLGENGAGKTTLMCLLAGLYRPDGGVVELSGRPVTLRSPRQAMALGVGMVHQHFMLVPSLTVAENVLLGAARIPLWLRRKRIQAEVQRASEALGFGLDAGAYVEDLSVGERQRVEILRVLHRGARVMILDEPTAVLSPAESEALFASLGRLCAEGCAVVIISHKLAEVRRVAHRITVMRRGRVVAEHGDPAGVSAEALAAEMVGREVSLDVDPPQGAPGEALLRVQGLEVRSERGLPAVRGVSLELRRGEILGLAGVSGNGQRELMEALAGLRRPGAGEVTLAGESLAGLDPRQRVARGLRYVPEDRTHTGTAPGLSVRQNLILRRYRRPPCARGPWLDQRALDPLLQRQIAALQVSLTGLDQQARLLSGGNIQKLVLARELSLGEGSEEGAAEPGAGVRLLLAMQPTRGLDAWAVSQVRRLLVRARAAGCGVLLCSEDLDELCALSDRVAVMAGGALVGLLPRAEASRERIGRLMTGAAEDPSHAA